MRFYCLEHVKDIYTYPDDLGRVQCDIGPHYLGKHFPYDPFWEYCCECRAIWPANDQRYTHRSICPACKRELEISHLCHRCETFGLKQPMESYEAEAPATSKPVCIACATDLKGMRWHYCLTLTQPFQSMRHECPFCNAAFYPLASSDVLSQLNDKPYQLMRLGESSVDQTLVVDVTSKNGDDGRFFLLAGTNEAIGVPRHSTLEMIERNARNYRPVFIWPKGWSGEMVVERPAIFERHKNGWRLKERGRLAGQPLPDETTLEPTSTYDANRPPDIAAPRKPQKKSAAEYLNDPKAWPRVELTLDILNINNTLLVAKPGGELVLLRNGNDRDFIVIPSMAYFSLKEDFYNSYQCCYDCENPAAGEVQVIEPAVVGEVSGGWALTCRGLLEITPRTSEQAHGSSPYSRPSSTAKFRPAPAVKPVRQPVAKRVTQEAGLLHPKPKRRIAIPIAIVIGLALLSATVLVMMWVSRPQNKPGDVPPPHMVKVPGGTFLMGNDNGDEYERPQHRVTVKPFFIDMYEVTCEEYAKFIKDTNHRRPSNWKNDTYPEGAANRPVTGVDWDDANSYAAWADKRLPTEEEWEFAARGPDGFRFPWGNDWKVGAANADNSQKGIADVGKYKGSSPFGAYDMVGNVWEWTANRLTPYPGEGCLSSLSAT